MLILLKKINTSSDTVLMVEDLFLLMSIHARTEYPLEKELHQDIKWYYKNFRMYDNMGEVPMIIPWSKRIEYLMRIGMLDAPYGEWVKIDQHGFKEIDLLKLEVTEKFKKECLVDVSKKDQLWEYFLDEYGHYFYIGDNRFSNRLPPKEVRDAGVRNEEAMKDLFWKHTGNGTRTGIAEVFDTFYKYKEHPELQRLLGRFLLDYQSIKNIVNKDNK